MRRNNMNKTIKQKELDAKLKEMYQRWYNDISKYAPTLLKAYDASHDTNYSNPYYISTPNGWETAKHKILVVGEEGHGDGGAYKADGAFCNPNDYEIIQGFNYEYLYNQWLNEHYYNHEVNGSRFWAVFRKIKNEIPDSICAWSNIDKIHRLGHGSNNCALREQKRKNQERQALHGENITKVLMEEIKILQPSVVIFLGYHSFSLKHENEKLYNEVNKFFTEPNKQCFCIEKIEGITYFVRYYHPGARNKGSDYETNFIEALQKLLGISQK